MNPEKSIDRIVVRLNQYYMSIPHPKREPLSNLIKTILSQNTNDRNCDRAYQGLMDRFEDLHAVKDATPEEIAVAIKAGGLQRQKALRIKRILQRLEQEQGRLDLSFLADLPLDEALQWLRELPGIGKKTAGIVLLFSFDKPYFPVDTHIRRVITRLGLVGPKDDPHQRMNAILPQDAKLMANLHLQLIRLGRELCHPRRPECEKCVLAPLCRWFIKSSGRTSALYSLATGGENVGGDEDET